jgi:hypothetical protein
MLLSLLVSLCPSDPRPGEPLARPLSPAPYWNHGPGTSGGGSATLSGETLRRGKFALALRGEYTSYEDTSRAEAEAIAAAEGEFDALGSAFVTNVVLAYGVTDDLELGLTLGHYSGRDFIDAEEDGLGGAESATADPSGLTDTWLDVKYRLTSGASGHLSWLTGIKLPTGKDDERLDNDEELEPSSQPGSGSIDYRAGFAYSRFLDARTTLDSSFVYTIRTAHEGFVVGDRADLGLAVAWRLTEDARAARTWTVFGELAGTWLEEDVERGEENDSSGGTTVFLAGGVRARFGQRFSLSIAPAVPILQDLNGEQVEADARLALTLGFTP